MGPDLNPHFATLTNGFVLVARLHQDGKIATRTQKNTDLAVLGTKWVRIGPILKVIHISLLYSPWGPFPDRFVQHLAFRASQLAGQLASNKLG